MESPSRSINIRKNVLALHKLDPTSSCKTACITSIIKVCTAKIFFVLNWQILLVAIRLNKRLKQFNNYGNRFLFQNNIIIVDSKSALSSYVCRIDSIAIRIDSIAIRIDFIAKRIDSMWSSG